MVFLSILFIHNIIIVLFANIEPSLGDKGIMSVSKTTYVEDNS